MRIVIIAVPLFVLCIALVVVLTEGAIKPEGVSSSECLTCHKLDQIGIMTTSGIPLPNADGWQGQLHQALNETDCLACHTMHADSVSMFQHELLIESARTDCALCHILSMPDDDIHSTSGDNCHICHSTDTWASALFDHDSLTAEVRNACALCHIDSAPSDTLHASVVGGCGTCHTTQTWFEVQFTHDQFFRFDRRHPSTCTNCHLVPDDFSQYSCYGSCHAHNEASIIRHHLEEGIRNYQDCAQCHRSGTERD